MPTPPPDQSTYCQCYDPACPRYHRDWHTNTSMPTPPPDDHLPTEISYTTIESVCALLAPHLPINQIIMIEIDPRYVAIKRRRSAGGTITTTIPITHPHGSYTEGGEQDDTQ